MICNNFTRQTYNFLQKTAQESAGLIQKINEMNLQQRIALLVKLGGYMTGNEPGWAEAKERALQKNPWFNELFTANAIAGIAGWLEEEKLTASAGNYQLPEENSNPATVGIVMAGNIPLVGFHDWLCVFMTGHIARVKLSSKDDVLLPHLVQWLEEQAPEIKGQTRFEETLKGADAYIATGSNNSARYFDQYFGKFPNIIRKNRTSAAILTGEESPEELNALAADIHLYFGMGCRNVTKLFVPENYDFLPLLEAFEPYAWFFDHPKFRSNFDYHLAVRILNKEYFMTKNTMLLVENKSLFAPISVLHYEFYRAPNAVIDALEESEELQCLVGRNHIPFGKAQAPDLADYADGVDTMAFLKALKK